MPDQAAHIAVVDDDPDIRSAVAEYLQLRGYRVTACADGRALDAAMAEGAEAVILDLHMPGENGLDLARRLSGHPARPGVIMLTGDATLVDRVLGLEVGADDYLAKPVELRELLARLRAVLRRRAEAGMPAAASATATEETAAAAAEDRAAPDGPHAAFALRLRRATQRANFSRGQIARDVAADKSAVSRWFRGAVRPQENSLVALTALIAARLPGFTRAAWDAPEPAFAAAIGEVAPAMPIGAAAPVAPDAAEVLPRFEGLWLGFFPYAAPGRWLGGLLEIGHGPAGPAMRLGAASGWEAEGEAHFDDGQLWLTARQTRPRAGLGSFAYWAGNAGRPVVIDGLLLVRASSPGGAPTASRTVAFRLGRAPGPSFARHAAAVARLRGQPVETWQARVAAALAPIATHPAGAPWLLQVSPEQSLAIDEGTLAAVEPRDGPRRSALASLRGAFADLLQGD